MLRYMRHLDRLIAAVSGGWEAEGLRRFELSPESLARETAEAEETLAMPLAEYGRRISSEDMAISLQSAALLAALCRTIRPRRVLDTGSGFSSYVVRRVAADGPPCEVFSVDDDRTWLDRTAEYLRAHDLPEGRLLLWDEFAGMDERDFDLVFHDLGRAELIRLEVLPDVCRRLAPKGLLLLDDFHKHVYRMRARRVLAAAGLHSVPLRSRTLDGFGRYAALARAA